MSPGSRLARPSVVPARAHQLTIVAAAALLAGPLAAQAAPSCADVLAKLGNRLLDATCVASPDLTTTNPATTPADNSNPNLPIGAWTPTTDRAVIAPGPGKRTPITKVVPGLQIQARIAGDPTGEARFLLRLPNDWNGRLVVAGASGTRSEFNGDFAWSDYVVQKGYAYASQNKGVYNLRIASTDSQNPPNDLACRLNPSSTFWVNFYDNDAGQPFTRWRDYMVLGARLARTGVQAAYGHEPSFTYAVGTSNGGYQVRRAVETAPEVFDGGIDWEGTFVDEHAPNLLSDLPAGVLNFPDYVASGNNPASTAARNLLAAGYPPDIVLSPTQSLWTNYWTSFWEVTHCQWQKRLDPAYDTYGAGVANYNYVARLSASDVGRQVRSFSTTGVILRPLITLAGTMDALLPIDHHARAYARAVDDAKRVGKKVGLPHPAYRLYEVQNGNHIEAYQDTFTQLELIEPHAQHAFDLLVGYVEAKQPLPADQCVPRHGAITEPPTEPGHCANLFEP
jgi:hypothetical protein